MSDLTWTTEPPTKPGFYWWRSMRGNPSKVVEAKMVRMANGKDALCIKAHGNRYCRAAVVGGQWFGPLEPPGEK